MSARLLPDAQYFKKIIFISKPTDLVSEKNKNSKNYFLEIER